MAALGRWSLSIVIFDSELFKCKDIEEAALLIVYVWIVVWLRFSSVPFPYDIHE